MPPKKKSSQNVGDTKSVRKSVASTRSKGGDKLSRKASADQKADVVDATSAKLGSQKSASRYNEDEADAAEVASVVQPSVDQNAQEEQKVLDEDAEQPMVDTAVAGDTNEQLDQPLPDFDESPSPKNQDQNLTKTIKLTQESWTKVVEIGLEPAGIIFFKHVFKIAPEALQLFSFKDEPDVYESDGFKKHAMNVMKHVGIAVEGLNDLEKLVPVLKNLGKRHVGYNV
jgi:hypothetical protein